MLHVDESLMNSDDVNMKNSNPDCSSKSQIAGRSRLRKSDIQDNALPKKCFDIKFSQEWGDDVRQEVVSLGDEEVKSSHVNTTTIRSNRSNQEVCCDMGLGEKQPVPDDRLTASVSREGKENSKIRQSKNLQSNLKISIDEVGSSVNEALLKRKRKSIQSNEDCDETCFGNLHRSPSNEYFKDKNCNNELNQKNSLLHRQNKVAPSRKPNQRNMRRRRLETSVQSDPLAMPLRKSSRLSIHRYGVTMIKSETITLDVSTTSSVSSKTSGTSLIHLLFSGIESSSYASTLQKLGARETEDSMLANYLVTDQIKRTLKTLYSRARGIPIISVEWLKACKVSRKGPNPDPLNFMLHYYSEPVHRPVPSRRSSKRASVQLSRRLQTSETGDNGETDGFLSGWSFCCTQNVVPPLSDLRKLTELSGGYWMSDEDLMNCVNSSPKLVKSVIITTQEDYDAVSVVAAKSFRKSSRSLKNTASRNHNSALSQALSTLVKVSVDWFLQTIMNRQPPVWPVDSQYTIQ
ncbi:unnamed protein product [Heterobilharzia americana]|nr:unnamed protein product [Heterobilharzia americana]